MRRICFFLFLLTLFTTPILAQKVKKLQSDLDRTATKISKILPKEAFLAKKVGKEFGKTTPKFSKAMKALKTYQKLLEPGYTKLTAITKELVKIDTAEAAQAIETVLLKLEKKSKYSHKMFFILGKGLASFKSTAAFTQIGEFILQNQNLPIAQELMFYFIQENRHPNASVMSIRLFQEGSLQIKGMALDHLKLLRSIDSIPILIQALKKETTPSSLQEKIISSLEEITGGTGNNGEQWEVWWEKNKATPLYELRIKRLGETSGWRNHDLDKIRNKKIMIITSYCTEEINGEREDHNFDYIEEILLTTWELNEKMVLVVEKKDFLQQDLKDVLAILINCNHYWAHCTGEKCVAGDSAAGGRSYECTGPGPHRERSHEFSKEARLKIKKFVEQGGYLFTEDWVLEELLELNWPNFISSKRATLSEEAFKVDVFINRKFSAHPYLRGIWGSPLKPEMPADEQLKFAESKVYQPKKYHWQVDEESPIIEVAKDKCQILVKTQDPRLLQAGKGSAIVVLFSPKDPNQPVTTGEETNETLTGGRVLHVLSHFNKQEEGDQSLQNILLNFLLEAAERQQLKLKKANQKKFGE